MAVLQCMKMNNIMQTLSDFQGALNERIQNMASGYDEVPVVFD